MKPCHALAAATAAVLASSSLAQTHLLVPSQYPQIGAAIQAAAPGAIVEVAWQATPYQPFVVDRPITIVGFGGQDQAPAVAVGAGVGITFALQPGERATIARLDVRQTAGTNGGQAAVATAGMITFEECRFGGFDEPTGAAGLAAVDATDCDLAFTNCRIEPNRGMPGLRALRCRVHAVGSRFFGSSFVARDGLLATDSDVVATASWFQGGDAFVAPNATGGNGLRLQGTARAWLVDANAVGGIGAPAGNGVVNTTAVPVDTLGGMFLGGVDLTTNTRVPGIGGPHQIAPGLLGLTVSADIYRRGTLRPGMPFGVSVATAPASLAMLCFAFAPTATAAPFTVQPALLLHEVAFALPLVGDPSGHATWSSAMPNVPGLVGTGLWLQAFGGSGFPFDATPACGLVVR